MAAGWHYAGKILKGANPSNLPVQQSTKVELITNLKTATDGVLNLARFSHIDRAQFHRKGLCG